MIQRPERLSQPTSLRRDSTAFPAASPAPGGAEVCPRCAGAEIWHDEVLHRGLWALAECVRCGERWTRGPIVLGTRVPRLAHGDSAPDIAA